MIGIPYAVAEVTTKGLIRTCPICGERILELTKWFDGAGEHLGKDSDVPESYALHYAVMHGEAA